MRPNVPAAAIALCLGVSAAVADPLQASGSGAVGAGAFASEVQTTLDAGLDVDGDWFAVGVGARLRFVGDQFRHSEWDQTSEWVRVLRYALVGGSTEDAAVAGSVALGELGSITVGAGALVDGYGTGLNVDRARVGADARGGIGWTGARLVIDDVVDPTLGAVSADHATDSGLLTGVEVALDVAAPSDMDTSRGVFAGAVHGGYRRPLHGDGAAATIRLDAVGMSPSSAGAHLTLGGTLGDWQRYASLHGSLRYGSPDYVPGWFGPLYEVERESVRAGNMTYPGLAAAARALPMGGLSKGAVLSLSDARIGAFELRYSERRSLGDLVHGRLSLPGFHRAQLALVGAASMSGRRVDTAALASELRVRLPRRLFLSGEMARVFRDTGDGLQAIWVVGASVGAVFGESL